MIIRSKSILYTLSLLHLVCVNKKKRYKRQRGWNDAVNARLTFCHAKLRASFFFWSSSLMVCKIFALSFSTILFFFIRSLYCNMDRHRGIDVTLETSPPSRSVTSPFLLLRSTCSLPSCWRSSPAWWWSPPASSGAGPPHADYLSWSRTKCWAGRRTGAPSGSTHVLPASATPGGQREERKNKPRSRIKQNSNSKLWTSIPAAGVHPYVTCEEVCVCVYLVGSILAVFAMLINVVFQFLDLQLDFIALLSYFICLCALPLNVSNT